MENKKLSYSVNKRYVNFTILLAHLEEFAQQLEILKLKISENEHEEHFKYPLRDFFKNTFYQKNAINTKKDIDFVIHVDETEISKIGVIIETKIPNSKEMISVNNLQKKSIYQCLLYFLQERIINENNDLKHIIITDFNEWFIFDATEFEKYFYENKDLKKEFENWNNKEKINHTTDLFYKEIAPKYIKEIENQIVFTHFELQNVNTKIDENKQTLADLYKIFSPHFLLKKSFENDNNTLDKTFYFELLYLLGLEEVEESGKILIKRKKKREIASLMENTISLIEMENELSEIEDIKEYGTSKLEQIENIALELNIVWINRIIFLKLLEAQLISFNRNNKDFAFLNISSIDNFGELNDLFFGILAKKTPDRIFYLKDRFTYIPYLNSSLFEVHYLEKKIAKINTLKSNLELSLYENTVLKDEKKSLPILEYIFKFLDAFNFTSIKAEEVQEEQKNLINSAVLGLIFEKINGYKEGAFFTPSYITMYMSRETIRRAILQKFTDAGYKNLSNFEDLKDAITDRKEANKIINTLKICDPAVGSGHFLVSALNEIIAIKSELGILQYRNGRKILDFKIEVVNDELFIRLEDTEDIFEYRLSTKGNAISYRQELQEALFHEKQYLIENCLFGVDINANSVNICRLRLWIELLKNAYYTEESKYKSLETLPNIDINIKKGNSLVSCFSLNGENGLTSFQAQKMKLATQKYKEQVILYKSTTDKIIKQNVVKKILELKKQFAQSVNPVDSDNKLLRKKKAELGEMPMIFTQEEKKLWQSKVENLTKEIVVLEEIYKEKLDTIYGKAFEWRFEFPEVLDENGNFEGFDIVMGNPPYISSKEIKNKESFNNYKTSIGQFDLFSLFIEFALSIIKPNAYHSFIIPDSFLARSSFAPIRKYIFEKSNLYHIVQLDNVFEHANVSSCVYFLQKKKEKTVIEYWKLLGHNIKKEYAKIKEVNFLIDKVLNSHKILFLNKKELNLVKKMFIYEPIGNITTSWRGEEIGKKTKFLHTKKLKDTLPILTGENVKKYFLTNKHLFIKKNKVKKDLEKYLQEKIVIRQLGNHIYTTIANQYVTLQSVYCLFSIHKDFSNYFLLGILNSKYVDFVYNNYISEKQTFPRILLENLRKLTIPKNLCISKKIEGLVKEILNLKEDNKTINISKQEKEIDELVYKLYDLNKSEIKLVKKCKI